MPTKKSSSASPATPQTNPSPKKHPRIPPVADGIQVNFCKNPSCTNFGFPAPQTTLRGQAAKNTPQPYTVVASGQGIPLLRCNACGEHLPMKSNQGIAEEVTRLGAYLLPKETAACPSDTCTNHGIPISTPGHYYRFGTTAHGSPRYRCRECGKTFAVGKATRYQKQPHKNREVFSQLMNKAPFRRILEMADITAPTLYHRIDFFHRQALAFAADREAKLKTLEIPRLYLGVDRQDYPVNWTRQSNRKNVMLSAVASADNATRYVFGMHLNFDPEANATAIEADARSINDAATPYPFRKYARLWLDSDYQLSAQRIAKRLGAGSLSGDIQATYQDAQQRADIEALGGFAVDEKLPDHGMQTRLEYTLYAHFFHLKNLLGKVEKFRFFLDQDSGIRAACLGAFHDRVLSGTADAFFVRIAKDFTVNERRKSKADAQKEFNEVKRQNPGFTDEQVKLVMIHQRMASMPVLGPWRDRWLLHPLPSMSEPQKAICFLTDRGQYTADHTAWLYNKASLHAVDSYFNQIRRRIAMLERPLHSSGNAGRTWNAYGAYNPEQVARLLDIFRVYHNFILPGEDGQTPAMRLGLARGPVKIEDVIYFA